MNIVIVESAAKAKTINKYLGRDYKVIASYGHVRDLPSQDGSVEPDADFLMHWDTDSRSDKILREIAAAVKGAERLILATDPDREGEAISWHILQVLEAKRVLKGVAVERVAFNAVTKSAIMEALSHPRAIDAPLVDAYLARRALDYLVGFTLSPVLWRKLPGARSAGRVQSVALRLVCDRELEIEKFRTEEYWTIDAALRSEADAPFTARLTTIGGKKMDKFALPNEAAARPVKAALETASYRIASVASKPQNRRPAPPFTTSTLQMDASRKLGFSAAKTMQVAQRLYEGVQLGAETVGLITYMRTDGVQIVPEAIHAARRMIEERYGVNYRPEQPRFYKTQAKNAQEAHEAIRPTDFSRHPDDVGKHLDKDQFKLYALIWRRAVASQMAEAIFDRTTVELDAAAADGGRYGLRATGQVLKFDGFLALYREGRDEGDEGDDNEMRLPPLKEGEKPKVDRVDADQHFTEPPPRYTEATLVKKMEELGIGRPSTYASTLSVLQERDYVRLEQKKLIPEDKGRLVTAFLESFFDRYVEYDFTASLEQKLDLISAGNLAWKQVLKDFWSEFFAKVNEIKDLRVAEVLEALNDMLAPHIFPDAGDGTDPRKCPSCESGRLSLKVGKFGAFIGCSNYPECKHTRQFSESAEGASEAAGNEDRVLGKDPASGLDVLFRNGRFGPYVQLGEAADKGDKPKRMSVPKGMEPAGVDLDRALALLSLPREVGKHPETGETITASLGKYGPYVAHQGKFASLSSAEEVFSVGINRAVAALAEKNAKGGRAGATVLKELGDHPSEGGKVEILSGRFGPYVKHGKINATLPRGLDPDSVTMDDAVRLIAERAAKPSKKAAAPKRKAAPKKSTDGKTAAAKPATRKSAAKSTKKGASKSSAP